MPLFLFTLASTVYFWPQVENKGVIILQQEIADNFHLIFILALQKYLKFFFWCLIPSKDLMNFKFWLEDYLQNFLLFLKWKNDPILPFFPFFFHHSKFFFLPLSSLFFSTFISLLLHSEDENYHTYLTPDFPVVCPVHL